jgi:NitT/TauT family transport system substrate-binding protein
MTKPITVYENLRGVVYTPFYLAVVDREWAQLGLDVQVQKSPETSETAIGLMAGRVDVSWGGPMRVMMHHDQDPACSLVCFGQVVSRDPFMLVGREPKPDFRFSDLEGKRIAVANEVPTPWLTFQDDLDREGIDPASLNRVPDKTQAENVERLRSGDVDVIQVFEPYASKAAFSGFGHIWHRFSVRGDVAFTTFYTTRKFRSENTEACETLVKGISNALTRLYAMSVEEIVGKIGLYFPDLDKQVLAQAIDGYRTASLWARDTSLPPTAVVRLKAALLSGEFITRDMPYEEIVVDVNS